MDQMFDDDFVPILRYAVIGTCNERTAAFLITSLVCIRESV